MLGKTLGVPLFQEQAMRVAIECAGFTASEADALRKSMATFKSTGGVSRFRDKLVAGMVARGYTEEFAKKTFKQLEGFGSYGFPESHAASFALLAYASSWIKCHHPDIYCAAILNAQPMGFYAPAQLVRDACQHGVEMRSVCINASRWDCSLESSRGRYLAVRLGLRMVKGLVNGDAARIVAVRANEPFRSVEELWRRARVPVSALERLAEADAFGALGLSRRQALWAIRALRNEALPLFAAADNRANHLEPEIIEPDVKLAPMRAGSEVVEDYRSVGLTLRRHPVAFLREELARQSVTPCADLMTTRDGRCVTLSGIVLVRQKPGSAKGVLFITIEDESGTANLVVWPSLFEKQRSIILSARMIACRGRVQKEGEVTHVIADHLTDLSRLLHSVSGRDDPFPWSLGRGDQPTHGSGPDRREELGTGWRNPRDIYSPDLRLGAGIKVRTRDFR